MLTCPRCRPSLPLLTCRLPPPTAVPALAPTTAPTTHVVAYLDWSKRSGVFQKRTVQWIDGPLRSPLPVSPQKLTGHCVPPPADSQCALFIPLSLNVVVHGCHLPGQLKGLNCNSQWVR